VEVPGLLTAQRDRGTVDSKLERIAAERGPQVPKLSTFYQTEHHQPLHGGITRLDRFDTHAIARFEVA
jgi:hypothetical protein